MIFRNGEPVRNDVVDIVSAHRARISKVIDLNGGRPSCKHTCSTGLREAVQINCDFDFTLPDELRNLLVAALTGINEMLERAFDFAVNVRIPFSSKRYGAQFETRSIVLLENTRHQTSHRMIAQVRREIANTNAIMTINFTLPESRRGGRKLICDKALGIRQLISSRRGCGENVKWPGQRSISECQEKTGHLVPPTGPIANHCLCMKAGSFQAF